jgi:hypothetical protein
VDGQSPILEWDQAETGPTDPQPHGLTTYVLPLRMAIVTFVHGYSGLAAGFVALEGKSECVIDKNSPASSRE